MTEETLQTIEECGAALMPIAETCQIAEISPDAFEKDDAARRRYDKGALKTRFAVRQAVVKLAKAGNPQALKTYEEMAAEVKAERDGTAGSAADDEFANL